MLVETAAPRDEVAGLERAIVGKLLYQVGKDPDHARIEDWYAATALALRDRVVDRWHATNQAMRREGRKRVYYLSLEFLIGRLLTDTGSFGKLFSEALENIDEKQVEGVRSTGANRLQRARFGVIPQVTPVLLSQVLYFLESNTRGATVIGAIVGGGIGLLLTQAIQTQKDWEDVAYYMVLIVLTVIAMDSLSGWLRRKLIKGT